jgi:hypothetical protein
MSREKRAAAKATLSSSLAATGAAIGGIAGGPVGATIGGTIGALTGLVVADQPTVLQTDYICIPAFEYSAVLMGKEPSHTILAKEGEVIMPIQPTEAMETEAVLEEVMPTVAPKRRKASKYNRAYAKAFKEVSPKYKKKSGGWQKNGFKNAQKAAHALAKRRLK